MGENPAIDTKRYMEQFNRVALAADEQFQWVRNDINPTQIDPGELEIPKEMAAKYGLTPSDFRGNTVWNLSPELLERIAAVRESMRVARRTGVKEILGEKYLAPAVLEFDVSSLSSPSQQALSHFARINRLTDELKMLVVDPRMLEYEQMTRNEAASGYADSARLFAMQVELGCGWAISDPLCDVVDLLPSTDPNTLMWPDDFTEEDLQTIESSNDPNKDLILSHFTVVERDGHGGYRAISYNEHPALKSRLLEIAGELEAIAEIPGIHESIQKTTLAYAKAIREGRPTAENHYNPFEEAEDIWSKNFGGDLAFTWGPFEEDDPYGKKRGFQFVLFSPSPTLRSKLEAYQANLPGLETMTERRVDGYKTRPMTADSIFHASDVVMRAGNMHCGGGEYLAEVLPNDGPLVEQGRPRREIFANFNEAKGRLIMKRIAEEALDPAQLGLFDPELFVLENAAHELAHPVGPRPEHEISTPDLGRVTAITKMGAELYVDIEESKATTGGIQLLMASGLLSPEEAKRVYVTYVVDLLRQLRFGMSSRYSRSAAAELGYLFASGGVKIIKEKDGKPRIHVNLDKMPVIVDAMYIDITTAQQQGSRELAEAFFAHSTSVPEAIDAMAKRYAGATPPIPQDITFVVNFKNDPFGLAAIMDGTAMPR